MVNDFLSNPKENLKKQRIKMKKQMMTNLVYKNSCEANSDLLKSLESTMSNFRK